MNVLGECTINRAGWLCSLFLQPRLPVEDYCHGYWSGLLHWRRHFEYLESISPAERDELLDVRAGITALGFVLTPGAQQEILQLVDSWSSKLRGPLAMGLRYAREVLSRKLLKTNGGERGIRTLVRVSPKHAFQACAFNHSAISPFGGE